MGYNMIVIDLNQGHCLYWLLSLKLNTYITRQFIISTSDSLNVYNYDDVITAYIRIKWKHTIHDFIINKYLETMNFEPFNKKINLSFI